jgi:hypothetical protein
MVSGLGGTLTLWTRPRSLRSLGRGGVGATRASKVASLSSNMGGLAPSCSSPEPLIPTPGRRARARA